MLVQPFSWLVMSRDILHRLVRFLVRFFVTPILRLCIGRQASGRTSLRTTVKQAVPPRGDEGGMNLKHPEAGRPSHFPRRHAEPWGLVCRNLIATRAPNSRHQPPLPANWQTLQVTAISSLGNQPTVPPVTQTPRRQSPTTH